MFFIGMYLCVYINRTTERHKIYICVQFRYITSLQNVCTLVLLASQIRFSKIQEERRLGSKIKHVFYRFVTLIRQTSDIQVAWSDNLKRAAVSHFIVIISTYTGCNNVIFVSAINIKFRPAENRSFVSSGTLGTTTNTHTHTYMHENTMYPQRVPKLTYNRNPHSIIIINISTVYIIRI